MGNILIKKLLKLNKGQEIHRVYQKLRIKEDIIRNIIKFVNIVLRNYIMKHIVFSNLQAHKIKIK